MTTYRFGLARIGAALGLTLFATSAAHAIDLQVENNQCPVEFVITAINATPNSQAAIVFALNQGAVVIPTGPCAGTPLGLGPIALQQVGTVTTNANGFGFVTFNNVPPIACNGFVQLVEIGTCNTSTVWPL